MKKSLHLLLVVSMIGVMFLSCFGIAFGLTKDTGKDENGTFHALLDPGPGVSAICDRDLVMPGDIFTVDFSVRNITENGLYGASFDLKFDNSLVEVVYGDNGENEDIVEMGDLFEEYQNDMISLIPYLFQGEERTIDDLNEAGYIDYVVLFMDDHPGVIVDNNDWYSFARITFQVKEDIDFTGSPLQALKFNFQSESPDTMTNGTAVVKLADSSETSEGFPNKVTYTGINTRVNVIDPNTAIVGRVINAETGAPIAGASISGIQTPVTGIADLDGWYAFLDGQLTRGNTYNFSFTASGWGDMVDEGIKVPDNGCEEIISGLFPALDNNQYRVVLKWKTWDGGYRELDAHMIIPPENDGGEWTDVYWEYHGNGQTYPYAKWMGDQDWLIESIILTNTDIISGIPGPYQFIVEDWERMDFDGLDAYVQVYDDFGLLETVQLSDANDSGSGWDVLIIDDSEINKITVNNNLFEIKGIIKLDIQNEDDIQEDDTKTATFKVTLLTERMDLTNLDPAAEIDMNMWNSFGSYQGRYIPEDSGEKSFVFEFSGVIAGQYRMEAWLRGANDKRELFVDSLDSKPVIYRVSPWVIPSGYQYFGFGMHGYNLDVLHDEPDETAVVKLVDPETGIAVASTNPDNPEDWLGVKFSSENDYTRMDVQMKATEGRENIDPGSYDVVITNDDWDWVIGKRYQQLEVTDQPALRRHVYPWVLGAGAPSYSLEFEGINFDKLISSSSANIEVKLLSGDTFETIATCENPEIIFKDIGQGWIKANFTTPLPEGNYWVYPTVQYSDGTVLPGGDQFDVEVVDFPKVYGLENNRVIPGKTSYDLMIKGWNLDGTKTYLVEVDGPDGLIQEASGNAQYVNPTELSFTLSISGGLPQGGYDLQVWEKGEEYKQHLGGAWLNVEPVDVAIEPNGFPVGYAAQEVILTEPDNIDVWEATDTLNIRVMYKEAEVAQGSDINVGGDIITFILPSELAENGYEIEVVRNGCTIAKSWLHVYSEPLLFIDPPVVTLQEDGTRNIDFSVTLRTENIDLNGLVINDDIRVDMWSEFRHYTGSYVSRPENGSFVFEFTDVEAGDYMINARVRNGFGNYEHLFIQSYDEQPVIYQIRPQSHPMGNNHIGFDLAGVNLNQFGTGCIMELVDNQGTEPVVVATTDFDDEWTGITLDNPENPNSYARVTMKAESDDGMLSGSYDLRIYDPTNTALQPEIRLEDKKLLVTTEARLHGVEPNRLGVGGENYYIKLHGINLEQLSTAQLSVELKHSDETLFTVTDDIGIVTKEGGFGYLLAEFSTKLPTEQQDLQVLAKSNGVIIPGGEKIGIWVTDQRIFTDIFPSVAVSGKTFYSFDIKGWNFNADDNYWAEIIGPNYFQEVIDPNLDFGNENTLQLTFDTTNPMPVGDYQIHFRDQHQTLTDGPLGILYFKLEPGKISLPPTSLTVGYGNTLLTISDNSGIGDIWEADDDLVTLKIKVTDENGVPQGDASVAATDVVIKADTIEFTLPAGLEEGYYLIEVYRGDEILVGKGAGFEVQGEGLDVTIFYSTTQFTNQDVVATLTANEQITITNNDGSNTYTFTQNGSFTFEFQDVVGNMFTATAQVNNIDKVLPVIILNGSSPVTLEVGTSFSDPGASASDDRDGPIQVSTSGLVDANTVGTYVITYTAVDSVGNQAEATRTVNVVEVIPVPMATNIDVTGVDSIIIPTSGNTSKTYTAFVKDQNGNIMPSENVIWSLAQPVSGITLTSNVDNSTTIDVDSTVSAGSVLIKANADSDNLIMGEKLVTLIESDVPSVIVGSASGLPGEQVEIEISIDELRNMASYGLDLQYDPAVLTPVSITNGDIIDGLFVPNLQAGLNLISVANTQFAGAESGTNLCKITFQINENAETGLTSLTLIRVDIADISKKISVNKVNGNIEVLEVAYGDVNGDGEITPLDATLILRHYVKLEVLSGIQFKAADVDGDEELLPLDATLVLRRYVKLDSKFPVE